ncbi:amino acid ABC transporter substrate-binding protein [Pusillimonas sp. DMV24BSW_D]|uniref:ABC transporter substrate-binding protein n=1 Tax=Neopusillimonas aestuarii TaxID=2716226 RepID=UPI00140875DB|nr:ABC transporter substrate-binding protein [Pusillimonas sp. DMV24BSW_D]QIM48721.1 amino acid ABC transporter substrate-binding protein [Pusillimonas sp. DMV24BSW_D]
MKHAKKSFAKLLLGLACAASFGFGAMLPAQAADEGPRKIGFLMPLTGGAGKLGEMMMQGSTLAVEEINSKHGGAGGRNVQLLPEDSQATARVSISGFKRLSDLEDAEVVITGWTSVVAAVAPLAQTEKVMLISASTASPAIRGVSPYFQSTWMFDDETVRLLLPYAKEHLGVERLGVMTVVSDLGNALAKSVKEEWKKLGGTLAGEGIHQQDESNFRPILLKLLATNPDAIYITGSVGRQSAQIVRQARELGYKGKFLSYGAFEDPEIQALGELADGAYYASPSFEVTSDAPKTKAFVDAFKAKHDRLPNVHQANHYDLIYLYKTVVDALAEKGSEVTGTTFRDYMVKEMPTYTGAAGTYRFDYSDGSVVRPTSLKTLKDGQFVKVADLVE